MISRVWHGWTTVENADVYEKILLEEVIPGIEARGMKGFQGIQVFRRPLASGEVEFMTVMRFSSLELVKEFVGEDYEVAHVPARAREVLSRFDDRSRHYEIRDERTY